MAEWKAVHGEGHMPHAMGAFFSHCSGSTVREKCGFLQSCSLWCRDFAWLSPSLSKTTWPTQDLEELIRVTLPWSSRSIREISKRPVKNIMRRRLFLIINMPTSTILRLPPARWQSASHQSLIWIMITMQICLCWSSLAYGAFLWWFLAIYPI